jgi:hypothetical protein
MSSTTPTTAARDGLLVSAASIITRLAVGLLHKQLASQYLEDRDLSTLCT